MDVAQSKRMQLPCGYSPHRGHGFSGNARCCGGISSENFRKCFAVFFQITLSLEKAKKSVDNFVG
jgi:hypothetical protein